MSYSRNDKKQRQYRYKEDRGALERGLRDMQQSLRYLVIFAMVIAATLFAGFVGAVVYVLRLTG